MSKVAKASKNEVVKTSDEKTKEAKDSLKVQLEEHLRLADHHKTMATKAQGALEVLMQLHPEDEENK